MKPASCVGVDGEVGQVRRQHDRRLPEHLAVDHDEAARQRGAEPLQVHLREHQMRGGRADVDADGGQLDIVGGPGDLVELLAGSHVGVAELQIVHRAPSGRRFGVARFVDELAHAGLDAVLRQLVEIDAVDARVLVLVFDLAAAFLHVDVHAHEHMPLGRRERIAQAAEGDREIARRIGRGVEVLVEHLVGRREHDAVLPVDAHQILGALVPEQRIAVAGDGEDVEVGAVAVGLLVGADRHLRDVGVHGAVGEHEHHVGAAGAALAPGLQLERRQVGDEVGLPHVAAGPHRDELAFAAEMVGRALPLGELILVVEDEASLWNRLSCRQRLFTEASRACSRPLVLKCW